MNQMEEVDDSGKVEVDDSDSVRSNYTSINENDNISHYNPRYDANQYPYQGQTFNAKIVIPPESDPGSPSELLRTTAFESGSVSFLLTVKKQL